MSKKVVLQPSLSSLSNKRQPLLRQSTGKTKTRLGEAVGGTAAVCCCCPCAVANVLFLAIYKVPASICQRALRKRKQRRRLHHAYGEELPPPRGRCTCGCYDDVRVHPMFGTGEEDDDVSHVKSRSLGDPEEDRDVLELEKEMWDRFYSTGFWRSPSQRDSISPQTRTITPSVSAPNLQVLAVSTL